MKIERGEAEEEEGEEMTRKVERATRSPNTTKVTRFDLQTKARKEGQVEVILFDRQYQL